MVLEHGFWAGRMRIGVVSWNVEARAVYEQRAKEAQ